MTINLTNLSTKQRMNMQQSIDYSRIEKGNTNGFTCVFSGRPREAFEYVKKLYFTDYCYIKELDDRLVQVWVFNGHIDWYAHMESGVYSLIGTNTKRSVNLSSASAESYYNK